MFNMDEMEMDQYITAYKSMIAQENQNQLIAMLQQDCSDFCNSIRKGYGYITNDDIQRQFLTEFEKWDIPLVNKQKLIQLVTNYVTDCGLIGSDNEQY